MCAIDVMDCDEYVVLTCFWRIINHMISLKSVSPIYTDLHWQNLCCSLLYPLSTSYAL